MKNKIILAAVIVAIIAVVIFLFIFNPRKGEEEGAEQRGEAFIIESDDGAAKLEIPEGALPEGISSGSISVKRIKTEKMDDADKEGLVASYRFEPDGLSFNKNIFFTTTIDNINGSMPMLFHKTSDGKADLVGNLEISINLENNKTTIVAPLAHFSSLNIYSGYAHSFFKINAEMPEKVLIGDVVNAKAVIEKKSESDQLALRFTQNLETTSDNRLVFRNYRLKRGIPVGINGKVGAEYYTFEPDQDFNDRPAQTTFTGNSFDVISNDFRCEKTGPGSIYFTTYLSWEAEGAEGVPRGWAGAREWTTVPGHDKQSSDKLEITGRLECVASMETDTAVAEPPVTAPAKTPIIEMTFAHVKPGEYSEVYLSITTDPGIEIKAILGSTVMGAPEEQTITTDENGVAYFTWRIYSYGQYNATIHVGGETKYPWHSNVVVQ